MSNKYELKAKSRVQSEKLHIDYEFCNRSKKDAYLINFSLAIVDNYPVRRFDRLLISYESPDTAVLASRMLPIPEGMTFCTPPMAVGSRVLPGTTHKGFFRVDLPLRSPEAKRRVGPFGIEIDLGYSKALCKKARLELGVIPDTPMLDATEYVADGGDLGTFYWSALETQKIVSATMEGVSLPLVYTGDWHFWPF